VLRALERAGIRPDIVAGTSIGALVGAAYVGGRLDELEDCVRQLTRVRMARLFDVQFGRGGMISGRAAMQLLPLDLRQTAIETLTTPLVCVATDLANGHEVWLRSGMLGDAIRASCAVPGVFSPVNIDGRWLIDGALANPVPISVCRAMGAHLTIAVNINSGEFGEAGSAIYTAAAGPGLRAVVSRAIDIVQDRVSRSRLAGDPPDFLISPNLGAISLLDLHRAEESIAAGEAAAEHWVGKINDRLRSRDSHPLRAVAS